MAFFFGKKDKNPPEVAAPLAKTQPTPPKIQSPPGSGAFPAVKPPQPTGLMPAAIPAGMATTQPMVMPRTGGLKPIRPGTAQSTRSTQRIVLPTPPGGRPGGTKSLAPLPVTGRINLPIGMILRCLPPEVLSDDISKFEANGMAATEIGLPMNMILGQLPSGKVEMTLQDLLPHFPPGYLQPTGSIASYLPNVISLPLMDVVMRIPPDLLALRPDQKDVDASVINMADPFTEEILREQAETARRQAQTNIIEESQAPQEEFRATGPGRDGSIDATAAASRGRGPDALALDGAHARGCPADAPGGQAAHASAHEQPSRKARPQFRLRPFRFPPPEARPARACFRPRSGPPPPTPVRLPTAGLVQTDTLPLPMGAAPVPPGAACDGRHPRSTASPAYHLAFCRSTDGFHPGSGPASRGVSAPRARSAGSRGKAGGAPRFRAGRAPTPGWTICSVWPPWRCSN